MAFKTLYAAEDFDDPDEFFDCGYVDFLVVWRRFAKLQDSYKSLMVIFPVLGWFPMYRLNNEVKQTTRLFQSNDGDFSSTRVFPGVPFDKWVKQGKPIKGSDGDFSSTRVFPGAPFDSESSKENQSNVLSPSTYQDM